MLEDPIVCVAESLTAEQAVDRLLEMAGKAGRNVFDRLRLVDQVLRDREFVAVAYRDESAALDHLEAKCFGDLCGARGLAHLLTVYRTYPDAKVWAELKWNLTLLCGRYEHERRRAVNRAAAQSPVPAIKESAPEKDVRGETGDGTISRRDAERLQPVVTLDENKVSEWREVLLQKDRRIEQLEKEIVRLNAEIHKLKVAMAKK